MTFRIRLLIGAILAVPIGYFAIVAEEKYHKNYYYFSLTLLCYLSIYLLLYYAFHKSSLKSNWTIKTDKFIAFISVIGMLLFGINMSNRIDEHQSNFWVINGNRWLTDVFASIIAFMFLYVIVSWLFKQWNKIQTLKNEKSKAELALLKSQVNPHFFFNTLNNLYSLIKKDPDSAQSYVLKLADMMRFTIYDGKKDSVTVEEELNYLNNFIELQTARYHTKIDVLFKQKVKNYKRPMPPMLFIFLVENAFKHGVEKLIKGAFVHIVFSETDKSMTFTIKNNFDTDNISNQHGIGLKNLKERLDLLFPKQYNLITSTIDGIYSAKLELTLA